MNRRQHDTPNMPASPDLLTSHRSRRLFGKQILIGLPTAMAAALVGYEPHAAEAASNNWSLNGNTILNAKDKVFLGTKNLCPLVFKTFDNTRMTITEDGNIGIGTAIPSAKLEVKADNAGIRSVVMPQDGNGLAVFGGVFSDFGSTTGVFGFAGSGNGAGVRGLSAGFGVTGGGWMGVEGRGSYCGVSGVADTEDSAFGVLGVAENGNSSVAAIWGRNSLGRGFAGYFEGDVSVTGRLNKSAGAFRIDHPLDPANKYLSHSFIESPDMMNVYNGNVTLDANGMAVVELPDYFEALNRDFRYQLTAIGSPGPNLHIAQEIASTRFTIAGGSPGIKVSWQVTGVRHDPYAEAHRIVVEQDKPADERGTYLAPREHGQPETKRLNYDKIQQVQARSAAVELSRPAPPVDESPSNQ